MNLPTTHTTPYQLVLPFYGYAAFSFLATSLLLVVSSDAFTQHYFNPPVLAITHIMALGWGTMMILGASHQLIPVLTGHPLANCTLAIFSFILPAAGIPLLAYAFYVFDLGWPARTGGILINGGILCYLVNLSLTVSRSRNEQTAVIFVFTATCWLLLTTVLGLLLVYNFSNPVLPADSLHYLSLHAHTGIAGWFLLMVLGIGSKLVPMFLISKYQDDRLLWAVYLLINISLLGLLAVFFFVDAPGNFTGTPGSAAGMSGSFTDAPGNFADAAGSTFPSSQEAASTRNDPHAIPAPAFLLLPILAAIGLFGLYCKRAYRQRIRKKVDLPVKTSLLSVLMLLIPLSLLLTSWFAHPAPDRQRAWILAYGYTIFFGWITTIILGMTFKTLPFIVWNKIYRNRIVSSRTPDPRSLYRQGWYSAMIIFYLLGFALFTAGIITKQPLILQPAAVLSLVAAVLYALNVWTIIQHRPMPPDQTVSPDQLHPSPP